MPHVFHEGERAVQDRAGVAATAARVAGSIHPDIPARARSFLPGQSFAVLASRGPDGDVWASLVHGSPGFLSAPDAHTIAIDTAPVAGDPLGANLAPGAPLGALVIDLATRHRMRANGHVTRAASPIRMAVTEVFANCPKYIQRREIVLAADAASRDPVVREAATLSTAQQERIARADTFFVASGHGEAGLDASHRGGAPGFVEVLGPHGLAWPDYAGNAMFQTLGNLASDPHAGLVFVDFATGDVLQLSGRARVDWDPRRAARLAGAERVVDFAIDRVRAMPGALPLRAHGAEPSPFNP